MTPLEILINVRIDRLERNIETLDVICKSLKNKDVSIEIEIIRNIQADLMFIIDNLKYEKQLKHTFSR